MRKKNKSQKPAILPNCIQAVSDDPLRRPVACVAARRRRMTGEQFIADELCDKLAYVSGAPHAGLAELTDLGEHAMVRPRYTCQQLQCTHTHTHTYIHTELVRRYELLLNPIASQKTSKRNGKIQPGIDLAELSNYRTVQLS